jgi:hypothetical protein
VNYFCTIAGYANSSSVASTKATKKKYIFIMKEKDEV